MPSLDTLLDVAFLILAFGASLNLYRIVAGLVQIGHSLVQIARDIELIRVVEEERGHGERAERASLFGNDPRFDAPARKKRA